MEVCKGLGGVVDLTENLIRAFNDPELFEQDEETGDYYTWSDKLEFPIEKYLITGDGRCNWDAINYVSKHGNFYIHAGDRDSFGWLTGVIEPKKDPPEWTKGKRICIVYG